MSISRETDKTSAEQLDLETIRERCTRTIEEAYDDEANTLVEALPAMGKTHSAVKAAATTDTKVTILTTRGRKEQYDKISELCEEFGLSYRVLPSAYEECPVLNGEIGEDKKNEMEARLESLSITAGELHSRWGELDCQKDGECRYESAWDEVFGEDVYIGHYLHAHNKDAISDRTVVFDEFPDQTYICEVDNLQKNVTRFVYQKLNTEVSGSVLSNYNDVIKHCDEIGPTTLRYFRGCGRNLRDLSAIQGDSDYYHPYTPLATMGMLNSIDLGNGWRKAELGYGQVAAKHEEEDKMYLLTPPNLDDADKIISLDGTPSYTFWWKMLNTHFTTTRVLDDEERKRYIREVQGLKIVTVSDSLHPYLSGKYVETEKDAALLRAVEEEHGQEPGVISSRESLNNLEEINAPLSDASTYYGNVKGSNELGDEDVGVILGSPEPSSKEVKKEAALWGYSADIEGQGR